MYNFTAINKDIEAHIDHQDRTTSHDNNHNNNLTHNNKQLNNNVPSINIHPFPLASLRSFLSPFQSISCSIRFTSDGCMAPISLARPMISSRRQHQLMTSRNLKTQVATSMTA
jgi:hypothetical protein